MVKIITLVENTTISKELKNKHGICLYIETENHKILFDIGPNALFIKNAKKLGINLKEIDTVIISHGHTDHAGALKLFLQENHSAKIYVKESAFEKHYTKVIGIPFSVSIDKNLKDNPQIIFTQDNMIIDDELSLYSNVTARKCFSKSNNALFAKNNGKIELDSFNHEQYLVINNSNKNILFSGCSHNGILNIIDKGMSIKNTSFDYVIGGFHLFNPLSKKYEDDELINKVAKQLKSYNSLIYTCHCTGSKAYEKMKKILGDNLQYLATGSELEIK